MKNNSRYTIESRTLWVEHDDERIFGELFVPHDAVLPLPAVICSHQLGGTHQDSGEYARELTAAGFVSYAFDFCGGAPDSQSTGETTKSSIQTQKADLDAVLDAVKALDEVDAKNVFLMGQSQGAAISIMLADERPHDVRGLILLYPALSIHDVSVKLFGAPENIPAIYTMWQRLGRIYALDAFDYDIFEHMANYQGNVLIYHGDLDSIVPLAYARRAEQVFSHAKLHVVPGAKHGFFGEQRRRIVEEISAYIRENATA